MKVQRTEENERTPQTQSENIALHILLPNWQIVEFLGLAATRLKDVQMNTVDGADVFFSVLAASPWVGHAVIVNVTVAIFKTKKTHSFAVANS